MLSARQLLLMRRARDRTIHVAIAPIGTVALLPDPDFRRRVLRCVSHVGFPRVVRWIGRMDKTRSFSVNFSASVDAYCDQRRRAGRSSYGYIGGFHRWVLLAIRGGVSIWHCALRLFGRNSVPA